MALRDKAKGINQEAFKDGKSIGIMASYLHKDVKEAVLELKNKIDSTFGYSLSEEETLEAIDEIFGDFTSN